LVRWFKGIITFLLVVISLIWAYGWVYGQESIDTPVRSDEYEREVLARLTAISSEAAPFFQLATQAMDAGEYNKARDLYLQVLELAPDFPDALRRLSYVALKTDRLDEAISYARKAYQVDGSAGSKTALAAALNQTGLGADKEQALNLAEAAVVEAPDSGYANIVLLEISVDLQHAPGMRIAVSNLLDIAPDQPLPHYFASLVAVEDGDWELAASELERAQALGMPVEEVNAARQELKIDENLRRANWRQWLQWGGYVIGVIVAIVVLVIVLRD
jgi:tetratricopeptide (TPR) repeat protein